MSVGEFLSELGLTAHYHLANLNDSSGAGQTLTNGGSVSFGPGVFGNGADFGVDGTGKSLYYATPYGITGDIFTVALAFRIMQQPASGEEQVIFALSTLNNRIYDVWYGNYGGTYQLKIRAGGFTQTAVNFTASIAKNNFLVYTSTNGTGICNLYINGEKLLANITPAGSNGSFTTALFGGWDGNTYTIRGIIDEILVIKGTAWADADVHEWYRWQAFGE